MDLPVKSLVICTLRSSAEEMSIFRQASQSAGISVDSVSNFSGLFNLHSIGLEFLDETATTSRRDASRQMVYGF